MLDFLLKNRRNPVDKLHAQLKKRYPQYEIGRGTYCIGKPQLKIYTWGEGAVLKMGSFCSIAVGVKIYLGGEHRIDWGTTYPFNRLWLAAKKVTGHPKTKGDVIIGNDVWIGTEAMIMSGVTIGDGAVIGARALVTCDVPPYGIAVGNPATVIKKRFDEKIISRLLKIKWWDWDDEMIEKTLPLLLNEDIEKFLEFAENINF